ncbi:MAG: hypothetical protein ACE5KZ_04905 [Candidatus Scalinduaceae bacterium]
MKVVIFPTHIDINELFDLPKKKAYDLLDNLIMKQKYPGEYRERI